MLLSFQTVHAQEGFEMLEVPTGTISTVDTEIEATIENWGYEHIFVAIPEDWDIDTQRSGVTRSYPVREWSELWRVYGLKAGYCKTRPNVYGCYSYERITYPRGRDYPGIPALRTKQPTTMGGRTGWWLRPNEGIYVDIYVSDISASGGTVDPFMIEDENPEIRVAKWYQSFTLELSEAGFITAPWVVEGAVLVESTTAVHSNAGDEGVWYYERHQIEAAEADVPAWDEWFDVKNSLTSMMTDTRLAPTDLEFLSIEDAAEVEATLEPVWRVEDLRDITYAYDWRNDKKVKGITLLDDVALDDVPEWFELF